MITRRSIASAILVLVVLTVSFVGPAASARGASLAARLRGSSEVPGPGDPDGKGRALIHIAVAAERLCWAIRVRDIDLPAIAAHVHAGRPDVAGPVVVTLGAPDGRGVSAGCAKVDDRPLLRDIKHHPRRYYVNVHTTDYPAGAVRGQLHPFSVG